MEIQHADGEGTTLVLTFDEAYALAQALIRAGDHGFDFTGWRIGPLRDWSLKALTRPKGTKDHAVAYGDKTYGGDT